jgi:hypothetical protein
VCHDECGCDCGDVDTTFDTIAAGELVDPPKLFDICRSNIGWYIDRSIDDHHLEEWSLKSKSGLYILWHKDGYCAEHGMFHMRALYVGKGAFGARMKRHWANQPTADQMLIYFTCAELPNRMSKYVEQLLLDCYDLSLNKNENMGRRTLCTHFTQCEVN